MPCAPCGRGFHAECRKGCKHCHPKEEVDTVVSVDTRKSKVEGLRDEKSTGRKRAANLYPIDSDASCEWRMSKNCGGGRFPVIGCLDGKQQERHHGPVKRTIRNEAGNVHRICEPCHVHWHELNDLVYDETDYNNLPHMPVEATVEEVITNTLAWKSGEIGRKYKLASSENHNKSRAKRD